MSAISYKCPNCGGDLQFNPSTQKFKCEYCISDFTQEELDAANPQGENSPEERPQEKTGQTSEKGAVIYQCPSCGAEVVTDNTTAATFCYYCHNPVILKGRLEGDYLPKKIIPFKISREKAVEEFLDFGKKKKFIPTAFFGKNQIEKISGIYFPYWVCQEELQSEMNAEATKVRVWRSGDVEYTETKFYDVYRNGKVQIGELTKNALKKTNGKLVEGVQPFPMTDCQKFKMGFLSGFQAEKRDIERADLEETVHKEAEGYAKEILRSSVKGYTAVNVKESRAFVEKENWDYVLLPVWTLTYKGKNGKMYYYAMNGDTGTVYGELPVDAKKIGLLFAGIFISVLVLCLIGGYFI